MNVYFFQCNDRFHNSVYLPYASGILWSYVSQFEEINNNYQLKDIFFEKLPVSEYVNRVNNPDIVLFSNYGWNTEYHLAVAKELKQRYPDLIVIIGGPNAQQSEEYLREHPYITYSVWGEGEETLRELLTNIHAKNTVDQVCGLSYIRDDCYVKTAVRQRRADISAVPSPYLTGTFDEFFNRYPNYNFMPVWETHRGCPYHCTFCDLGADYYNKVYMFDTERLLKEIDWFSDHKIEYVEVADANFGIFKRDLELVKYIKQKNVDTGFPEKINATWAKNSPDQVFVMSQILDSMNRGGVTLALQSQNVQALDNIKRINIANHRLYEVSKKYIDAGIQTYHDFILGLPGETLDSWVNGLCNVVDMNPTGWIFAHPLEAYENTEFADPQYIHRHQLKFSRTPQVSFFAHRSKTVPIEFGNYVTSTSTITQEQYIEGFLFKWFLIVMHSLGWANLLSDGLSKKLNRSQSSIYLDFYNYIKTHNGIINQEYQLTKEMLYNTINNGDEFWGRQIFGDDDIYWEYESATAITFEQHRLTYYQNLTHFVIDTYGDDYLDLVNLNDHSLVCYERTYPYNYKNIQVGYHNKFQNFENFCQSVYHKGRRTRQWKTKLHSEVTNELAYQ